MSASGACKHDEQIERSRDLQRHACVDLIGVGSCMLACVVILAHVFGGVDSTWLRVVLIVGALVFTYVAAFMITEATKSTVRLIKHVWESMCDLDD